MDLSDLIAFMRTEKLESIDVDFHPDGSVAHLKIDLGVGGESRHEQATRLLEGLIEDPDSLEETDMSIIEELKRKQHEMDHYASSE